MLRIHRGAGFAASVALAMSLTLSACGSDDSDADTQASPTPTAQTDEQALEQLAIDLWDARKSAENAGDASRDRFEPILSPALTERELAKLVSYQELGVTRRGGPEVTAVETVVDGETGTALMCINEDDWRAFEGEVEVERQMRGPRPYGFTAEKTDDQWLVTAIMTTEDVEAQKTC